jgi:argininosuccinate lyase
MALWGARFQGTTDQAVKDFSSSIAVDCKLWEVDIRVSTAHARMLSEQGILSHEDGAKIIQGLSEIREDISAGRWTFDPKAEDIHGEIEQYLYSKIGEAAKRMHTARSRNDQVATDTRLYLSEAVQLQIQDLKQLQSELTRHAEQHLETLIPGMTHMQHAQPVSLAHHLLAYFWMFERDVQRLNDSVPRILSMPLGCAALAGTGFPIDRQKTARELGFAEVAANSLDAVGDRDFVIEFLANASQIMMHLSRLCEELILWSAPEFAFVELDDSVTTGSSIMPQKKNPDVAELIRGRVGRVYGALMGALTMMKGLPLSYNRDLQEDKIHLFQGLETCLPCVQLTTVMLKSIQWKTANMVKALDGDFSNATDLADDLVEKGVSFREAHEVVGALVRKCIQNKLQLESLTEARLKAHHALFDARSVQRLAFTSVLKARQSEGGTAPSAVQAQLKKAKAQL